MSRSCLRAPRSLFAALLCLVGSGCYATASTGAYVETDSAPTHVEVYPREYYGGRAVYLVGDRWYYRDSGRWVYYTSEPPVLYERRVVLRSRPVVRERTVVRQAPPAHERRHYRSDTRRRRADRHTRERHD